MPMLTIGIPTETSELHVGTKLMSPRLSRRFFQRNTLKVARELLGKYLVRADARGSILMVGRIAETEAYQGVKDKACHASWRKRETCAVLWGDAGHAYVYFTYGLHWLLNLVTEREGFPAAVLVRAVEPIAGLKPSAKLNGPAKLTRALAIDGSFNGEDLVRSRRLWLADGGEKIGRGKIKAAKRVGVDYAQEYQDKPWRFYLKDSPFVSKK